MIFSVSEGKGKCIGLHMNLYIVFIELRKVFEIDNMEAVWSTLVKLSE